METPQNRLALGLNCGSRRILTLACVYTLALLAACDSGIGSDNQNPDPVVQSFPVAYVKRPLMDPEGRRYVRDLRDPARFNPGAVLYLKPQASASATAVDISSAAFISDDQPTPVYDVKDVSVSLDGERLLFAMRAPGDEDETTWNIWQYEIASGGLTRIIQSDTIANQGHDISPQYLPDGNIVFASTRQRQSKAVLLDEGKPQFSALEEDLRNPAFNLHTMAEDGSDITQITFNPSHDIDPGVLPTGQIVFSRWNNVGNNSAFDLYRVNPDGADLSLLYGHHSHDSGAGVQGQFSKPLPGGVGLEGEVFAAFTPVNSGQLGGDIVRINTDDYSDRDQLAKPDPGQVGEGIEPGQVSIAPDAIRLDSRPALGGRYLSAEPLRDGTQRYLISWSACRLQWQVEEENGDPAPRIVPCAGRIDSNGTILDESRSYTLAEPLYGLWIYDPAAGSRIPLLQPEENVVFADAVVAGVPNEKLIEQGTRGPSSDEELAAGEAGFGIVHIRSVYDLDGADISESGIAVLANPVQTRASERPARFLRVSKAVGIPPEAVHNTPESAFGVSRRLGMREILGYTPIEPDGSSTFRVPANVAFAIDVIDQNGLRIFEPHLSWLQVRPGETLECNGCHTGESRYPHRRDSEGLGSINVGASTTGLPHPGTHPELFADMGETMAETLARIQGVPDLLPDLSYQDNWTNPELSTPNAATALRYSDLATPAPVTASCAQNWTVFCRTVIHYETHIQPLWQLARTRIDNETGVLVEDHTCVTCHSALSSDTSVQIPAGQLDLTAQVSERNAAHMTSYQELLAGDDEQAIVDGLLVDRTVPVFDGEGNPVLVVDDTGEPILDAQGNPVVQVTTIPVERVMNPGDAWGSERFFPKFSAGGIHAGWLQPAELRLIAEWLDNGAQYYNDPFKVPEQ
ncbi:type II secretion system protein C [Oleiphilus messinensis]|uniref:Type II secretion system protein C n=1 Tax=Oleiphilus messinensis TaxID=141451 RepID=A0A1Y0I812_9GAMM|nr:PD40 domain-containing protein [Oleiphilus messinensis]ARU56370.1 type II secretion system protein C [Oleiphilus messinensis]